MTEAQDQYSFWRRRMAGEVVPIHDGEPQAGFYRLVSKDGSSAPVAYWFGKDGTIRCRIGDKDVNEQTAAERWPWASKKPIMHELYKAVIAGEPWPDQHQGAAADRRNSDAAPPDDSFEALADRIGDLVSDAHKLIAGGGAKSQEEADRASDLANRLGELHKQADTSRATEKKPHDDAAKAVQAKWLPIMSAAEVFKRLKAAVITPFLVAEDQKRIAVEQAARKAAEEAAKAGQPIPDPPAMRQSGPKAGAAGRRSVALRTIKVVKIADRAAVLAFFADNQMVTEVLETLAERATRAGVDVPGVTVTEEQRAA